MLEEVYKEADDWWVIGDQHGNVFLHWKGDSASGSYTEVNGVTYAERFDSKDDAAREAERVRGDFTHLALSPLKVTSLVQAWVDVSVH